MAAIPGSGEMNDSIVPEKDKQVKLGQFVNASGKAFTVRGISPMEPTRIAQLVHDRWVKSGRLQETKLPTYTVQNVAGVEQLFEHDEQSALEAGPEVLAAFTASQQALTEYNSEINMRTMRACFQCVMCDPMADADWVDRMQYQEYELPENRAAIKALYVETEVLASADDVAHYMTTVMRISGLVNEETAEAAEAAFRAQIQGEAAKLINT